MATAVTQDEIKRINELYAELKSYAAVARAVGRTAGTVKKYVVVDYVPAAEIEIVPFSEEIPDVPDFVPHRTDLGALCIISDEERADYEELRKEIQL